MTSTQYEQADGEAWARRWRSWLRTLGLAGGGAEVNVSQLEVAPGQITATAERSGAPPCQVEIRFTAWSQDTWQRVIDALGSQAIFAAQLLAGDLPSDLERALAEDGVSLLPRSLDEISHECSCDPDLVRPCAHLSAVYAGLGELLIDDPWLLFRLRGRDKQSILRRLRTQRNRQGGSTRAAHLSESGNRPNGDGGFYRASGTMDEQADDQHAGLPLEADMAQYWGHVKSLEDFHPHIMLPTVELALLRRLGPPPLGEAGTDTYDQLAALYRRISRLAYDFAFAAERDMNEDDQS